MPYWNSVLICHLISFVPSLDIQLSKDSLKPVLNLQLALERYEMGVSVSRVTRRIVAQLSIGINREPTSEITESAIYTFDVLSRKSKSSVFP